MGYWLRLWLPLLDRQIITISNRYGPTGALARVAEENRRQYHEAGTGCESRCVLSKLGRVTLLNPSLHNPPLPFSRQ